MKLNRRNLLMTPVAAALLPRRVYAMQLASVHGEIYRQIGIRPLINAAGTDTTLTGSLLGRLSHSVTLMRRLGSV